MDDTANEIAATDLIATTAKTTEIADTAINKSEATNNGGDNSKKDSSLEEDLLGANSLMMSDSEDDADDDVKQAAEHEKENINEAKIAEENSVAIEVGSEQNTTDVVEKVEPIQKSNKKISKIIDSDSSDDEAEEKANKTNEDTATIKKSRKNYAALLSDTDDDENESAKIPTIAKSARPKISALIDSDSEDDYNDELKTSAAAIELETNSSNKLKVFDFDEEDSSREGKNQKSTKKSKSKEKKKSTIIDTDSEDDEMMQSEQHEQLDSDDQQNENQKKAKQPKEMRASAKKALDDIQAIQSEQQRLHREAHISIPYHKPKRHTLQEFLKRRTIIKPTAAVGECDAAVAGLRQKRLKMTAEELEEYAKLLDERAKEAQEFFKSESESEEEQQLKPNFGVMEIEEMSDGESKQIEKEMAVENKDLAADLVNENVEIETKNESEEVELAATTAAEPMEVDVDEPVEAEAAVGIESEVPLTTPAICQTQPLVTEVVELPRLDLRTLHLNEEQTENVASTASFKPAVAVTHAEVDQLENFVVEKPKVADLKFSLLNDLQFSESPRLQGDANMLIDLESGDLITKQPTGADNLLQRLLATHKTKKHKFNETVNILSTENGKLEMTSVNFHHHDEETDSKKEQKPGAAYLKLKENLKTLIKKKRLEDMQKKQDDVDEYNKCLEGDDDDDDENEYDEEYEIESESESESDAKVKKQKKKQKINYDAIVIDEEENALDQAEIEDDVDGEHDVDDIDGEDDEADIDEADIDDDENGASNQANFLADEADDDDDDDDDDNESVSSSTTDKNNDEKEEEEEVATTTTTTQAISFKEPFSKRKSRIIKAFADDDYDDDDRDLLRTQAPIVATNVVTPLFGSLDSPIKQSQTDFDGIGNTQDELLQLCSGTFDATQQQQQREQPTIISQIPLTMEKSEMDTTRELLALCSGTFEQTQMEEQQSMSQQMSQQTSPLKDSLNLNVENQAKPTRMPATFKIVSSDEADEEAEGAKVRLKKLSKKIKKRPAAKLHISDDEDDEIDMIRKTKIADESDDDDDDDDEDEDENLDMPETYIEYDSEENEIVVEMTKTDCIQAAGNFFEKEAELSESEWGSADEDEKNLDHYDIELGDEDDFDREKLQQELGQIHARKMLDEDIREVRKIQEMLFEDEENDGVGRQRQFRWKNAENGFSLDDFQRGNDEGGNGFESGDEEQKQEHLWRKIRYEREQLLKEQGIMENSQEALAQKTGMDSPSLLLASNFATKSATTTPIIKKIQIITKKSTAKTSIMSAAAATTTKTTTIQGKTGSPFLISTAATTNKKLAAAATTTTISPALKPLTAIYTPPNTSTILQPKSARGSFLMRDKDSLKKFAANFSKGLNAASASSLDNDETAGTVSIKTIKAKNFVFATISKEEHEHLKRKADDLINSSSENGTNFMKKPRTNNSTTTSKSSMTASAKQCLIDKLLS